MMKYSGYATLQTFQTLRTNKHKYKGRKGPDEITGAYFLN